MGSCIHLAVKTCYDDQIRDSPKPAWYTACIISNHVEAFSFELLDSADTAVRDNNQTRDTKELPILGTYAGPAPIIRTVRAGVVMSIDEKVFGRRG